MTEKQIKLGKKKITRLAHQREHIIILCEKPRVFFFVWRYFPQNKALNRAHHPLETKRSEFMDEGWEKKRRRRSKLSFSLLGNTEKAQRASSLVKKGLGGGSSAAVTQHGRFTFILLPLPAFSSCLIAARHLSALLFFWRQAARQRHVANPPQNDGASLSLVNPSDISQNKTVKRLLGFRILWQRRGLAAGIVNCAWQGPDSLKSQI